SASHAAPRSSWRMTSGGPVLRSPANREVGMKRGLVIFLLAGAWIACGASGSEGRLAFVECSAGDARACECPGAASSTQTCDADLGVYGPCTCATAPLADSGVDSGPSRLCSAKD